MPSLNQEARVGIQGRPEPECRHDLNRPILRAAVAFDVETRGSDQGNVTAGEGVADPINERSRFAEVTDKTSMFGGLG